jgi:NTE family protein
MKGVAEIAAVQGIVQPVPIIAGVSAGAINAAFLAARADNFSLAASEMAEMWSNITADRVFRTDALSAGRSGMRLMTDAAFGALYQKKFARSLLDTQPLAKLLDDVIDYEAIERNIRAKHLDALAVTAMNYSTATSVTFVHGTEQAPMWQRARRISTRASITRQHIMASAAIPIFFSPAKLDNDHYGDGCLRNTAPLSPAIHLGADRLLVVSVRRADKPIGTNVSVPEIEPSIARILGVILNALLLDAMEVDMERMSRINATINFVPERQRADLSLRKVDYFWFRPSRDIGELAGRLFDKLPRVIRYLISGLGSSKEASELTSYLLFDPEFCGELVQMGYDDAMANRDALSEFLV